jgi:hypothetical protein
MVFSFYFPGNGLNDGVFNRIKDVPWQTSFRSFVKRDLSAFRKRGICRGESSGRNMNEIRVDRDA